VPQIILFFREPNRAAHVSWPVVRLCFQLALAETPAMNNWHQNFVRATSSDAVHRWADLEGKSPTMRQDLHRRFAAKRASKQRAALKIVMLSKLIAAVLNAWWRARSR
jgi:hypothetical protein